MFIKKARFDSTAIEEDVKDGVVESDRAFEDGTDFVLEYLAKNPALPATLKLIYIWCTLDSFALFARHVNLILQEQTLVLFHGTNGLVRPASHL